MPSQEKFPQENGVQDPIPPEFIAGDSALLEAWQRGLDRANYILAHPETQVMPSTGGAAATAPRPEKVVPEIVGSRARHEPISTQAGPVTDVSKSFGNPQGRSQASLRREQDVLSADLNATTSALDARRRRS